jgi:hypothetical protein
MTSYMAEQDSPAWDEAWDRLALDMAYRIRQRAWEQVQQEVRGAGEGSNRPSIRAIGAMKVIVNPPEFDGMPNDGEEWQYQGTGYGKYKDDLSGLESTGWFHSFRHRAFPWTGQRLYTRYLSSIQPPEIPAPTQRFVDNGLPF